MYFSVQSFASQCFEQIYILAKSVIDILIKDKRKEICDDLQQCVQAIISIGEQREREVTSFIHYSNQLIATVKKFSIEKAECIQF
ncbi:hypothetical protein T4E_1192 [Trichinella pseudospiralis]|uniref:Uncharacterized protein n=1 Tax=Trichinella pseudospiralis TaxID=6337 RepID=A0A0V0YMN7_TRIPS|nr:hypothetical protein T4E_1192 [Trichinella pseudospiralis]